VINFTYADRTFKSKKGSELLEESREGECFCFHLSLFFESCTKTRRWLSKGEDRDRSWVLDLTEVWMRNPWIKFNR
jgi:hypothetical protein